MDKYEYLSLFEKHLSGNASPEEEQILRDHHDDFELLDLPWDSITMGNKTQVKEKLSQELQTNMDRVSGKRINFKYWYAAAAISLIFSVALIYTIRIRNNDIAAQQLVSEAIKPIKPGGNKAILRLSNGSEVILGNDKTLSAIREVGTTISNKEHGILVYNSTAMPKTQDLYNKISTPRGGQYQVILSDGTRVRLNASSSLNFPTHFTGQERKVQLTGEAYFEVAKNERMPFKVEVNGIAVKVLGTHFNIMAYEDEETINTTLLEGAVEITNDSQKRILKPGQQAAIKKNTGFIAIQNVNTEQSVAWKNGIFMFTDNDIETIMRIVSRWYDVDVVYTGNLSDKVFAGSISRYEYVSEVLKMLELTGTIHFKIEGRRITVMP